MTVAVVLFAAWTSGAAGVRAGAGRVHPPRAPLSLAREANAVAAAPAMPRRAALGALGALGAAAVLLPSETAFALVKGSAPPKGGTKRARSACSSVDECRELGDAKEAELFADIDPARIKVTAAGDRYIDLDVGTGAALAEGSVARVRYRVLRLGKRARDGLSGEGSPIFSLGYGEDDDQPGSALDLTIGKGNVVAALDAGLRGMRAGGRRRINVRPERGWKLPDAQCLTTFTDVTIVPTTKVQENDACFSASAAPSPSNFSARRRMLRRYDETLIVDCELVEVLGSA
ncbi:hypothetical protein KFE25_010215 [Diacronema lutheri]|uniref:peptidylprolyl isomerase n=2 Tax=Diacronema lutheri TaxID=2081491 RepID=A0A8J5XIJ3_DIALT|nr:hypothetical protein KFE25_010215 [Diacronema lutheri]